MISPDLVSLFLNGLQSWLQNGVEAGISVNDLALFMLCFADDMVLLGDSPGELQSYLDLLLTNCSHWSLDINVMVF